eukprot:scaffold58618_cov58-Phaeocystis_antarctica.AAC.1
MGGKGSRQSRKRGRGLDATARGGRDGEQAAAVGRGRRAWRAGEAAGRGAHTRAARVPGRAMEGRRRAGDAGGGRVSAAG